MKIGILGGTFNPIHHAHLRIAEEAREEFRLDRVIFIPSASPPHKPLAGEVPFERRLRMTELAVAANPFFAVSDMEGKRGGLSYSVETLRELRDIYPEDDLFFIIGSDAFADIGTWRDYAGIFACVNIIVVGRPGTLGLSLPEAVPVDMAPEFCYDAASRSLGHSSGKSVFYLEGVPLEISSSMIRELAAARRSLRYLLPDAVEAYIKDNSIYG